MFELYRQALYSVLSEIKKEKIMDDCEKFGKNPELFLCHKLQLTINGR